MLLIANWKLNKNDKEAQEWLNGFATESSSIASPTSSVEVILAPSTLFIMDIFNTIKKLSINIKLAAQDVSKFTPGAHTGEVSANQLQPFINYAILGHSERKANGETILDSVEKAKRCLEVNITPILCFSTKEEISIIESLLDSTTFAKIQFAYEPIASIGTGNPASVESIHKIKRETNLNSFIYGGSVDERTVKSFLNLDYLDGFLVGSASLTTEKFLGIQKTLCA